MPKDANYTVCIGIISKELRAFVQGSQNPKFKEYRIRQSEQLIDIMGKIKADNSDHTGKIFKLKVKIADAVRNTRDIDSELSQHLYSLLSALPYSPTSCSAPGSPKKTLLSPIRQSRSYSEGPGASFVPHYQNYRASSPATSEKCKDTVPMDTSESHHPRSVSIPIPQRPSGRSRKGGGPSYSNSF